MKNLWEYVPTHKKGGYAILTHSRPTTPLHYHHSSSKVNEQTVHLYFFRSEELKNAARIWRYSV